MDRKEILISLTQALIRSRSYSGEEGGVVDTLTEFFKQNRFDEVRVDAYGSVIGSIYGRRPGRRCCWTGISIPSGRTRPPGSTTRLAGRSKTAASMAAARRI